MVVWTIIDPMYWSRSRRWGSDDFTSYGSCVVGTGPTSIAMAASVLAINLSAVVMAMLQAYKARNISTEFSESRYVALAMLSIFQVMVVGVPLVFLVQDNPRAQFFVLTGIITVVCMSVLLLIFVPKIQIVRRSDRTDSTNSSPPIVLNHLTASHSIAVCPREFQACSFGPTVHL